MGTTTCKGVEMFRKILEEGRAGETVGALLCGIKRDQVERGQVLAAPKSANPHTKFECAVYFLTKDEGGRHAPITTEHRPQFYFRTTDITGDISFSIKGQDFVLPGDDAQMIVELIAPVAMHEGLRFAVREGGWTIGVGRV